MKNFFRLSLALIIGLCLWGARALMSGLPLSPDFFNVLIAAGCAACCLGYLLTGKALSQTRY